MNIIGILSIASDRSMFHEPPLRQRPLLLEPRLRFNSLATTVPWSTGCGLPHEPGCTRGKRFTHRHTPLETTASHGTLWDGGNALPTVARACALADNSREAHERFPPAFP
jgi:hypothetical protein